MIVEVLPEKLGLPFGGCGARRHTKPKIGRRKVLLFLAASKENLKDLAQSSVSWSSKIGAVLS